MAVQLRSDSLHPCHHLSEPLRNMFWCRHCMKIFTDPIDRWRHSKACREPPQNSEEPNQSKQDSLKEGTLLRFGVWESDKVVCRPTGPNSKHAKQYSIRIAGDGKVANHKGPVKPPNFDLQCVICKTPFKSIDEMRQHVKTPCNKSTDIQSPNKFPSEITNVQPPEEVPQEDSGAVDTPTEAPSENMIRHIFPEDNHVFSDTQALISANNDKIVLLGNWDEIDGLTFKINAPEYVISAEETPENLLSTLDESSKSLVETDKAEGTCSTLVKLDGKVPALEITKLMLPEILNYTSPTKCPPNTSPFKDTKAVADSSPSPPKKAKISDDKESNSVNYSNNATKFKNLKKSKTRKSKKLVSRKKSRNHSSKKQDSPNKKCYPVRKSMDDNQSNDKTNPNIASPKKDKLVKKTETTKSQKPRKCPACSRIFKSLELLQRHNRVPCRVKLTRNVTAKVLRSKSQSSESGRILQRQGSSGAKPPLNKHISKRHSKRKAKNIFKVNTNLPQYRLVFESLDPKEQFFYKLGMVPAMCIFPSTEFPETKSIDLNQMPDLANPPSDEEPDQMPVLYQGEDEHALPPELEMVSTADRETGPGDLDFMGPPELDLMCPDVIGNVDDMNQEKAELPTKLEDDSFILCHTERRKNCKPFRSPKGRYAILDPIKRSAKKKVKQKPNPNSVVGRTSQRLKAKALAMETTEKPTVDQQEKLTTVSPEKPTVDQQENLTTVSPEKPTVDQQENLTTVSPEKPTVDPQENLTTVSPENPTVDQQENLTTVSPEKPTVDQQENLTTVSPEKPTVDPQENLTTVSPVSSNKHSEPKTLPDADLPNLTSSSNSLIFTNIIEGETTPSIGSPIAKDSSKQKATSPKRNLFEALGDSIQEFGSVETQVLENQSRILNKMLGVKAHLDNMLSPKRSPLKKSNNKKSTIKVDSKDVMSHGKPSKSSKESSPNVPSSAKDLETKETCTTPPNVLVNPKIMSQEKAHLDNMSSPKKSPVKKSNNKKSTIKVNRKDVMSHGKPSKSSKESSPNVPSSAKNLETKETCTTPPNVLVNPKIMSQGKPSKSSKESSPNVQSSGKNRETKETCTTPPNVLAPIRLPLLASRGSPRGISPPKSVATQVNKKMAPKVKRMKITKRVKVVKRPISPTVVKPKVHIPGSNMTELQRQLAIVRSVQAANAPVNVSKPTPQPPIISSVSMAKSLSNARDIPRSIVVSPQSCPFGNRALSPVVIGDASHVSNTAYAANPITEKVTVQYIEQTNTFPTLFLDETSGMLIGDEAVPLDPAMDIAIDPQFQAIQF